MIWIGSYLGHNAAIYHLYICSGETEKQMTVTTYCVTVSVTVKLISSDGKFLTLSAAGSELK